MTSVKSVLSIKAPKLTILDINSNSIKTIDIEIGQVFPNLSQLTFQTALSKSPKVSHRCQESNHCSHTCDTLTSQNSRSNRKSLMYYPSKNWILLDNTTWLLPGEYVCASPEELKGMSITAIELDCRSHTAFYLGVSIPSALGLCTGNILLIHYQWYIKYKLFLLYRNYYRFPVNNEEDFEMLQLQYHAYVSYNDESRTDDDWVMNSLQPNMEEGPEPQKLFIKNKDFMLRQSLIKGILSPHFVESQWCCHDGNGSNETA